MDGNGRWARKRGLPKIAGHKAGIKSIEEVIKAARDLGIRVLTFYTFSTENWQRPKREVDALMGLLDKHLERETDRIAKEGVRIRAIGRIAGLSPKIQLKLRRAEEKTLNNNGILVNFALNYGGRSEIVDACRRIYGELKDSRRLPEDINEKNFGDYLYTAGIPDPDLLIRTSGEMRLSNFLLWQLSYAEIYVTKKLWPDFRGNDLKLALTDFKARERRYGG